jgi:protein-S-isoprenylcysteine O-methyltransferase Ste14
MIARYMVMACWIVFLIYWGVSARSTKQTAERQDSAARMSNQIPIALGALLLSVPIPLPPLNTLVVPQTPVTQAIAVGACVLGVLGAVWSRRALAENWSAEVVFKENHELIERGPYRFVRHPIYTSVLLMILGSTLITGRLASWAGYLLFVVGFWVKLKQEEELLIRHFPAPYAAYKSRVKALIPFVI